MLVQEVFWKGNKVDLEMSAFSFQLDSFCLREKIPIFLSPIVIVRSK